MGRRFWALFGCLIWTATLVVDMGCRKRPVPSTDEAVEAPAEDGDQSPTGPASGPSHPTASAPGGAVEATPAGNREPPQPAPSREPSTKEGVSETPSTVPAATPPPPRSPLPDPRILLTQKDVETLLGTRVSFVRSALPGIPTDEDRDAILYLPTKGDAFGAAVQVFRGRTPEEARDRYVSLLASYPSAQEIQPIAGRTFFSYWEEVLHIGFLVPSRNLVVVASCGRTFCDSDGLYEIARRMAGRIGG